MKRKLCKNGIDILLFQLKEYKSNKSHYYYNFIKIFDEEVS